MGQLFLLRHGESTANAADLFGGWLDLPLTEQGIAEAHAAGRGLADLRPDAVHTSVLSRAVDTASLIMDEAGWQVPARRDWRLNERHYGALQGINKDAARARYGRELVEQWRRSVDVPPPVAGPDLLAEQRADARYDAHPAAHLIAAESLVDVARRMMPYWVGVLGPELAAGRTVLVVSHGNAMRALIHLATGASLEETSKLDIPTAAPVIPQVLVGSGHGSSSLSGTSEDTVA